MTAQNSPGPGEPGAKGAGHPARHPKRQLSHKAFWRRVTLVLIGSVVGVFGMAGFVTAIEWTNRTQFCISCHSMVTNYEEYKESVHYVNRTGARAECADCHVPKALGPKLVRKVLAVNDVIGEIKGTIATPELLEQHRQELAERVWTYMVASDSRECRACHSYESMSLPKQGTTGRLKHPEAAMEGKTCIECHKGVAHKLPKPDGNEL